MRRPADEPRTDDHRGIHVGARVSNALRVGERPKQIGALTAGNPEGEWVQNREIGVGGQYADRQDHFPR